MNFTLVLSSNSGEFKNEMLSIPRIVPFDPFSHSIIVVSSEADKILELPPIYTREVTLPSCDCNIW